MLSVYFVGQKGGLPGPPLVLHPESLAAQPAYTEALLPGSAGPNRFQALGSSPGMRRNLVFCFFLRSLATYLLRVNAESVPRAPPGP